jgi:hypothetical protein
MRQQIAERGFVLHPHLVVAKLGTREAKLESQEAALEFEYIKEPIAAEVMNFVSEKREPPSFDPGQSLVNISKP